MTYEDLDATPAPFFIPVRIAEARVADKARRGPGCDPSSAV
jgi:hypothetical protein